MTSGESPHCRYVLGFNGLAGVNKDFPSLTWCEPATDGPGEWRWESWDVPRPLYGLDRLAARPEVPVINGVNKDFPSLTWCEPAADAPGEWRWEIVGSGVGL